MQMTNTKIIHLDGFHNTEEINAIKILKDKFTPEYSKKHWLGQGTYFFDELELAIENKNMLNNSENMVIIGVDIEVPDINYLDLDNRVNQNKFRQYCNEVSKVLKKEGFELLYKVDDSADKSVYNHKEKKIVFRCYCLDLFKTVNNYYVIKKTFAKENPSYGVKVNNFDFIGFPYLETYICVSDNSYIKLKRIVEQEWCI